MRKIICDKCGKEQNDENIINLYRISIFAPLIYPKLGIDEEEKKHSYNNSFDLCDNCFSQLKDELIEKVADFLKK